MIIDDILSRFESVKRNGQGHLARCPSHEDGTPSLRITATGDGTVLLKCGAGCDTKAVLDAVGLQMRDLFPRREHHGGMSGARTAGGAPSNGRTYTLDELQAGAPWARQGYEVATTYEYTDERGAPLFVAVRLVKDGKKTFRQARAKGDGRWVTNLAGVRLVPYRLPQVLEQAGKNGTVFIVEGEKDVHTLERLGLVATTCPMGAGKWAAAFTKPLVGARAVVLPDNDPPGAEHAQEVVKCCAREQVPVRVVNLPGLPPKGDVTDWIIAGHTKDELLALVDATPDVLAKDTPARLEPDASSKSVRPSLATRLCELALTAGVELFRAPNEEAHATVKLNGRVETVRLGTNRARHWLRTLAYAHELGAPSTKTVDDALRNLEARAFAEGAVQKVHVRVAEAEGRLFIDLCNELGEVVELGPDGWRIRADAPVRFIRPKGLQPLPRPVPGGLLADLRQYLNVADEEWPLVAAWLVASLRPTGPYAVLSVHGEQGSAKSSFCKLLKRLVDPSLAELRPPPRDERDLAIGAKNGWLMGFDNLSSLDPEMSDAMCRLATGAGFATRELHSNDDEALFQASRPIVLNGIAEGKRSDLLDRSVNIMLPAIPAEKRRDESTFWPEFEASHARLLGAVCDSLVSTLRRLPGVKLDRSPRMADFARVGTAAEVAIGLQPGEFLKLYEANRAEANAVPLEAPLAQAIVAMVRVLAGQERTQWKGTASELLARLEEDRTAAELTHFKANGWPRGHAQVGEKLRRLAPNLRMAGIDVSFTKSGGARCVVLTRLEGFEAATG